VAIVRGGVSSVARLRLLSSFVQRRSEWLTPLAGVVSVRGGSGRVARRCSAVDNFAPGHPWHRSRGVYS